MVQSSYIMSKCWIISNSVAGHGISDREGGVIIQGKKHINIPIFIPHLGCPNMCVFCNQRLISGSSGFDPDNLSAIRNEIEQTLSTVLPETECEIAFFGGSFTGIDRPLMNSLLDMAREYVDAGRVDSIRLSTRPDYINDEIITVLKKYPVGTVELGIQSMDDRVLAAARRGHTAAQSEAACRMVRGAGISLVGQMMIGLPGSDAESEVLTARMICDMGASGARVYPTVVFKDTELLTMTEAGLYYPLDNENAVARTKNVLAVFAERGVSVLRVGLCSSDNLSSADCAVAGATHAAVGELAMGELYYDIIRRALAEYGGIPERSEVIFKVPRGEVSKCVGQKRKNTGRLCAEFGIRRLRFIEESELEPYTVHIVGITPLPRTGGVTIVP